MFAKNFYRPLFARAMTDDQVAQLAKQIAVVITAVALYFSIYSSPTLVALLLLGYAGVTQFFPGVILGLYDRRVTRAGVFAGMSVGVAVVGVLVLSDRDPLFGVNAGFLALCLNFGITVAISRFTRAEPSGFEEAIQVAVAE